MFHDMPERIRRRMSYLERLDARHRKADRLNHFDRLRQIPPATGKFLAVLAAGAPEGTILELGTSGGYSTMWLSLAARAAGRKIITLEVSPAKAELARETFKAAGIEDIVGLVEGDALKYLKHYDRVAFAFLDLEKPLYKKVYETLVPALVHGGLLVADNVISHRDQVAPVLRRALADRRVDAQIVPVGSGLLVARKV
jgi:predicted O-methyltransferase YrrM